MDAPAADLRGGFGALLELGVRLETGHSISDEVRPHQMRSGRPPGSTSIALVRQGRPDTDFCLPRQHHPAPEGGESAARLEMLVGELLAVLPLILGDSGAASRPTLRLTAAFMFAAELCDVSIKSRG